MASRAGAARAKQRTVADRGPGVTIMVDGRTYSVFAKDLSALDTAALRRELGLSFRGLLEAGNTDPDIDLLAGVMWLSRRVAGESSLTYAEVASAFTYDTEVELVPEDEAAELLEDGLPET